ncbi:helix-turn-helix transcriptional regulator [Fibrobacter succinogenes]|uniref:helix-turn-helix domain-containing protein n=1 Tax=Fibrobacter succinogenes TaxID=833 RepID=UPI001566CDE5|nr:helix-turn-helix transcriptional regulator [Fibrobacter succinogenes]
MPDEDARPGIKLEFIRRQKGISRKELADKLEIAPGALFNLENGFNPIHFDDKEILQFEEYLNRIRVNLEEWSDK